MGYELLERKIQEYDYDESHINSGDFITIVRLDGLSPIILLGSGAHASHCTMALRMDGELYIVESRDGDYWPVKGIQKTLYKDWVQLAKNADFNAVHMPLSAESRAKFNETKAIEFFKETEGLPYGFFNFIFGWVDTPADNLPPLMPVGFIPIVFSILEGIMPAEVNNLFGQAMNKRLNTTGLNIADLAAEAANQGKTFDTLMAEVEVEGWLYEGMYPTPHRSYVCSAYVTAMYKASGLISDIEATEFSPADLIALNVFDKNYNRPAECVEADPEGYGYCQFIGRFRLYFDNYSTIDPYPHMDEHCPSVAPEYIRTPGC
jgi:hypothetical protein